ncbi:hypothetical protein GWL_08670 [Herbaspirillum sp. GW103]|jgi:hypothetical protein|uniref:hypothetical protein n=1 Tax=unclassified Herbaspirillum TaxID=2624150 RepID=UPI00025E40BA|nr:MULTISPECIES: hypothetical protein [unclassified Herbaspirillum]EIJ46627.1 hypothetical protein GWL_08670 [Herbaspirillum sp. GW103]MCI1003674.1 hypothetical protein [Herbaspirillum sp. C7C8]NUT60692.1 hypothetical protein [Herbaspirillum sp. C9C3]
MNHDDNSIPLLTEIIPLAPAAPDYTAPAQPGAFHTQPAAASYQAPAAAAPMMAAMPPVTPVAEQYRQWEQEIRENVLQSLLERVDTVLHQHLQDQMALALDHLSEIVMQRVREGLRDALTETVERAVAEEMARFTSSKM